MLHRSSVERIAMLQGIKVGSNEELRGWNYFSIKGDESSFKSIHLNGSSKLYAQEVREWTQRSDKAFTLKALSTFIPLVPSAFISLVPSDLYVHTFHTLYLYARHTLMKFLEI